jgi:hypothetical protein
MSKLDNPTLRIPGFDQFEAVEFDATALNADKDPEKGVPTITFLTNNGQRLMLQIGTSATDLMRLATWATSVASLLIDQGRR